MWTSGHWMIYYILWVESSHLHISEPAESDPLSLSPSLLCQASSQASNVCSGAVVFQLNGKQMKTGDSVG